MILFAASCGDEATGFELVGDWVGPFGSETISETMWNDDAIVEYSEAANVVITQTAADAPFVGGRFNRIVYTDPAGGTFFYCIVEFGLGNATLARNAGSGADASDPTTGGCDGSPWTELRRR